MGDKKSHPPSRHTSEVHTRGEREGGHATALTGAPIRWRVFADEDEVAEEAARRILCAAQKAISARGVFRLVLAGGQTPRRAYRLLGGEHADWDRWEIFFGDERCLPNGDPDRNFEMAASAWLDRVPIPREHIHVVPAELGPKRAADIYEGEIRAALPFDMVLLGLGEDGHTASLFPGATHPEDRLAVPVVDAPKPPPERVSLSAQALSDTRSALVLVCGAGKRTAVRRWRDGAKLPIAAIVPRAGVDVLLVADAFGNSDANESTARR